MIAYLTSCMAIAVKCTIGVFLWFGITIGILAALAAILSGLKVVPSTPKKEEEFIEVNDGLKIVKFPKEKKDE